MQTGHTAKFRKALVQSGFSDEAYSLIFNDHYRRKRFRRLKLWFANRIFFETPAKQKKLEAALRAQFGTDILVMYFIQSTGRWEGKSLVIRLKPDKV